MVRASRAPGGSAEQSHILPCDCPVSRGLLDSRPEIPPQICGAEFSFVMLVAAGGIGRVKAGWSNMSDYSWAGSGGSMKMRRSGGGSKLERTRQVAPVYWRYVLSEGLRRCF